MPSRYEDNRRTDVNSAKNRKKKKSSGVGTVITTLLLIAAIGVFAFSAYKLVGYYMDYKVGEDEYKDLADKYADVDVSDASDTADASDEAAGILTSVEELEDPDEEAVQAKVDGAAKEETTENGETKQLPLLVNPIDFAELQAINEEVIGWIRIGALELSYPIAQAADNDYYLHRTFERQDNFAGCIFLNTSNSKYFTDQNSIVYGHNMKNGSMFGSLKNFKNQELYDSNPYFWIFTPTLIFQYRIFSVREVALNSECDVYETRYTTEDFQTFLDKAQSENWVDTHGLEISTEDRVATLSTCTTSDTSRFIVQGKLEQIYLSR